MLTMIGLRQTVAVCGKLPSEHGMAMAIPLVGDEDACLSPERLAVVDSMLAAAEGVAG